MVKIAHTKNGQKTVQVLQESITCCDAENAGADEEDGEFGSVLF